MNQKELEQLAYLRTWDNVRIMMTGLVETTSANVDVGIILGATVHYVADLLLQGIGKDATAGFFYNLGDKIATGDFPSQKPNPPKELV